MLHDKTEDISSSPAAEAMKDPELRRDDEGRRFLGMEGTQSLIAVARASQREVLADHLHDIAGLLDSLNQFVRCQLGLLNPVQHGISSLLGCPRPGTDAPQALDLSNLGTCTSFAWSCLQ